MKNTEAQESLKKLPSTPQTKDTFTKGVIMSPDDYEFQDIDKYEKFQYMEEEAFLREQEEALSELTNYLWEQVKEGTLELYLDEDGQFTFG